MKKYQCYPEFDDNDCLIWHVYEKDTDQIINSYIFEEDAFTEAHRLENGGGFAGFTPSFILTKVPKSINDAFAAEFA